MGKTTSKYYTKESKRLKKMSHSTYRCKRKPNSKLCK